jgi:hypothetical protein
MLSSASATLERMHYPHRGIDWDAVGLGDVPDTVLARELGVASQVVQRARARRKIGRFRSPASHRAQQVNWDSLGLGQRPDAVIAREVGITRRRVCSERRNRDVPPFVGLVLTQEGGACRSIYEAMFDACLHDRGTVHKHEIPVPGLPYVADFMVGERFVEIVGMSSFSRYREKLRLKRRAYQAAKLDVRWIFPQEVESAFESCAVRLRFRFERRCADCGLRTQDLVKRVCKPCYMRRWHSSVGVNRECRHCRARFLASDGQRLCSRRCYWSSLELDWPDWSELDSRLAAKPASQVARDLGVKPSALYMRLRRRRVREQAAQQ